jgi:alkylation response protein AidB-like acyl-CoA dehydrogenase
LTCNRERFSIRKHKTVPETAEAWKAFAHAGFFAAHHDYEKGGSQLPAVLVIAAHAYFCAANLPSAAYVFLTIAAANLIERYGDETQEKTFLPNMMSGQFAGTMAMTEPNQGLSWQLKHNYGIKPTGDK